MTHAQDDADGLVWTAVRTKPGKENLAITNLERQKFTVYAPRIQETHRRRGQFVSVTRPLFLNYVLVQVHPGRNHWRPLMSTLGVSALVQFGNQPGILPDHFVEALRARESEGVITAPAHAFSSGDVVRIVDGPFEGAVAKILSVSASDRLILLMDLLQQTVRVQAASHQVAAVGR